MVPEKVDQYKALVNRDTLVISWDYLTIRQNKRGEQQVTGKITILEVACPVPTNGEPTMVVCHRNVRRARRKQTVYACTNYTKRLSPKLVEQVNNLVCVGRSGEISPQTARELFFLFSRPDKR